MNNFKNNFLSLIKFTDQEYMMVPPSLLDGMFKRQKREISSLAVPMLVFKMNNKAKDSQFMQLHSLMHKYAIPDVSGQMNDTQYQVPAMGSIDAQTVSEKQYNSKTNDLREFCMNYYMNSTDKESAIKAIYTAQFIILSKVIGFAPDKIIATSLLYSYYWQWRHCYDYRCFKFPMQHPGKAKWFLDNIAELESFWNDYGVSISHIFLLW